MSDFEHYFESLSNYLSIYNTLTDCHLVDFLTKELWEKCLPRDLRLYIEDSGSNVFSEIEKYNDSSDDQTSVLCTFLKNIRQLKLENCPNILKRYDFLNTLEIEKSGVSNSNHPEFMTLKKWHEVDTFTKTVVWLNQEKSNIVIDAGSGKGYFSLHLANHYDLPVLAIEGSQTNHKSAILHHDLVKKRNKHFTPKVKTFTFESVFLQYRLICNFGIFLILDLLRERTDKR